MKALLITYHFPPMLGCCSLRAGAVARALAAKGWECHIVTTAISRGHSVYTLDPQTQPAELSGHVHAVTEGSVGRMVERLRKSRSAARPSSASLPEPGRFRASSRLTEFLRAAAFPDSKVSWIPRALGRVRSLLKLQRFDLIYSFGYPWSCHLVGYAAQRLSRLPWVADYADPWTLNPQVHDFPNWRKRLDFQVESRLLRRASAVVVATPESRDFLGGLFGAEVARRTHVARVAQFSSGEYLSPCALRPAHFQIAFTGLLHPSRPPYAFYEAAREIAGRAELRVALAGLLDGHFQDDARRLGLEGVMRYVGRLGRRETIELQQTSHVLLSFGWAGGLQVPCKIYEYFAARRPVLHIAGDARDPAAALVLKHRRGIVVPNEPQAIREALGTLYDLWRAGKLDTAFDLSSLPEFCLPRSLEGLEEAFCDALQNPRQAAKFPGAHSLAAEGRFLSDKE